MFDKPTIGENTNAASLPPISVSDVQARIKGAVVTDLGDGKLNLAFTNGMCWIVDTRAAEIPIDPDVVRRDYGRDVKPEDVVSGRTRIFDGQTFIDLVAGMSDAKTFSHEVFEASWGMLTEEEQNTLLNAYKSREAAADRYAAYLDGRVASSSSAVSAVFQRIKDFFMDIRASLFGRDSEDIFRQLAEGKVHSRPVQRSEKDAVRYEIRDKEGNVKAVDEIIEKPVEEWTNAEADKVLEALDAHIAAERARDLELRTALDNAPVGEKGKVIEAYEKELEAKKAESELAREYVSRLQKWQDFKDEKGCLGGDNKMPQSGYEDEVTWIAVEGKASKKEMAALFDAIAHDKLDDAKAMVMDNPALLNSRSQDPYYNEKKYWEGVDESVLPLYTPAEYADECRLPSLAEFFRQQEREYLKNKEESLMAEQERKTVTLAAGDEIIHKGYKYGKVLIGKISGRVYREEKDRMNDGTPMEQKVYSASFRLASSEKSPGVRVRIRSTKPIDLSVYENGDKPLLLTGQTFLMTPRDREGRAAGPRVPVLFARSIHEAVAEKGQPIRGGDVVVSKDDAVQTEFFSAARENLTGYVHESEYNSFNKVLGQPEQPFGYESRFSVSTPKRDKDGKTVIGEDGKPAYEFVQVHCITREPMQLDDMISQPGVPKLLSMKGAYQMYDVQRPDKSVARNVVTFEPTVIAKYKERTLELDEKANAPEVREADIQKGLYKGVIVDHDVQNDIYFQQIGSVEYAHDGANLDKALDTGANVMIAYKDGRGAVRELSKDKELENER